MSEAGRSGLLSREISVAAFQALRGEFGPDPMHRRRRQRLALFLGLVGVGFMLAALTTSSSRDAIAMVAIGAVFAIGAAGMQWLWVGTRYRFHDGELQAITAAGQVRWSERLASVQGVTVHEGVDVPVVEVAWPHGHRFLDLHPDLEDALRTRSGASH